MPDTAGDDEQFAGADISLCRAVTETGPADPVRPELGHSKPILCDWFLVKVFQCVLKLARSWRSLFPGKIGPIRLWLCAHVLTGAGCKLRASINEVGQQGRGHEDDRFS